ncbi:tetratricopeptide repeat protein [Deferribacter abyssi]|uniref:tetratricopeptide repeat protein n=1 Tax=Deferribacter abyssi TaxID=213806 RepID=UPI003C1F5A4E
MLELKSLLKGLILLFIVTTTACVPQNRVEIVKINKDYSPLFYITKKPTKEDVLFYKALISSGIKQDQINGKVLLGGYFYKTGEFKRAKEILEKTRDIKDKDVRYARLLWLFDIYLKENNKDKIHKVLKEALKLNDRNRLSNLICSRYPLNLTGNACLIAIYNQKFSSKKDKNRKINVYKNKKIKKKKNEEKITNILKLFMRSDENKKKVEEDSTIFNDKKICLNSESFDKNEVKGILYNIKKNKLDYLTEIGDNCDGRWYFSEKTEELLDKKGLDKIYFGIDYNEIFEEIKNYLELNNIKRFYVITNNDLNITNDNITVIDATIDALKNFFVTFNDEYDNATDYYFVFLGDSDESIKFVPLLKYYAKDPRLIKVIVGTDIFKKEYLDENFYEYFKGSVIVAPICEICDKLRKDFFKGFENFYNSKGDFYSVLGYDIVTFIDSELNNIYGKKKYLSGIIGIKDNKVYRNFEFYKILSKRRIKLLLN